MSDLEPIKGVTDEDMSALYAFLASIAQQVEDEIKAEYGEYLDRAESIEDIEEE